MLSTEALQARDGGGFFERTFRLTENRTDVRTEVLAGLTTFMTMAYIIFVNPAIVANIEGMPFNAVLIATVMSAALATLLMAFLANYPFALAPGMGLNAYFTFTVVFQMGVPWQTALGAVFLSGVLFLILTLTRIRELVIAAVPASLKASIAGGIGLFIAFIGAKNAGIVVDNPATLVALGDLRQPGPFLALIGLLLTGGLLALRVKGSILWGILITAAIGLFIGVTPWPRGILEFPQFATWAPVFGQLDVGAALRLGLLEVLFVFFFIDFFDTVGTLVGVSQQGGFLDERGRLPRANRALLSDSIGTIGGSVFGTPTVTTYIESASGVAVGGRTGMVGLVVAAAFLLSLFFTPLITVIASVPAATAPALIIVGALMMQAVARVAWEDASESLPAFVTLIAMPLTFSIANGIALGFISYPVIKLLAGRGREVHWLLYVLAALFILRFALLAGG